MHDWWPVIGETSVLVGSALGLIWALFATSRRRRKYLRASMPPVGQLKWFTLNFLSMGCYLTLVSALGLASVHEIIPQALFWYLLGLSALAFMTALLFTTVEAQRPAIVGLQQQQEPPAHPPQIPVRKLA